MARGSRVAYPPERRLRIRPVVHIDMRQDTSRPHGCNVRLRSFAPSPETMLIIEDQEYFAMVEAFAKDAGLYDNQNTSSLKNRLDYLNSYGGDGDRMRVRLWKDFAPFS